MIEEKKAALLYVLKILKEETDENHGLKQKEIIEKLYNQYFIKVDRKKIARDLAALEEFGFDIQHDSQGYKLIEREFDEAETHVLIDALLASKYITAKNTENLIDKLLRFQSNYFKSHVNRRFFVNDWEKTDNKQFFYNFNDIAEAIDKGKKISFDFYKYNENLQFEKSSSHVVSPYQFIVHNQRYYLMSYSDQYQKVFYCRVDRIKNVQILEDQPALDIHKVPGYARGIDFKKFSRALPYMFSDNPETIVFKADATLVDQVVDWFGKDIQVVPLPDENKVEITLEACPNGMEVWLLQYAKSTEVIKPESLRQKIIEDIKDIANRYGI